MMKTFLWSSLVVAAACKSGGKDAPAAAAKPAAAPTAPTPTAPTPAAPTPAAPTPAAPTPAAPTPAAGGPISIEEHVGDDSCVAFTLHRDGAELKLPKALEDALACPIVPPTLTPSKTGIVFLDREELKYWTESAGAHRLIMFEAGIDGVSPPRWSPDGTRLAVIVKGSSYPQNTRLFVLTLSATGEVTAKDKRDVSVFSPCGSVCTPFSADWKSPTSVEITTPGEGEPGPKQLIKL